MARGHGAPLALAAGLFIALAGLSRRCPAWLGPPRAARPSPSGKWLTGHRPWVTGSRPPLPRSSSAQEGAPAEGTSITAASLNLAKNLVGSGILSLSAGVAAFSTSQGGLGPASVILVLAALCSAYGYFLIGRVCEKTGAKTFGSAWRLSVGKGAWIPQLTCILECLGGSIVYAMVLGDMFSSLAQGLPLGALASRSGMIVLIGASVLFPLCCLRTFTSLAKFSALGTAASSYVVLFVVKRFLDGSYARGGQFWHAMHGRALDGAAVVVDARILILASILSTAFLVHFNAPQMYAELGPGKDGDGKSKERKFAIVAAIGFGLAAVQYALVMAFGFLTFGKFSDGNLLLNYAAGDPWAVAARVAIGLSVLFGYPMQFAGFRAGLLEAWGRVKPLPKLQHRAVTALLLSFVIVIACLFRDLGKFQAIEGALLASFLTYIAPPIMALRLWQKRGARLRYSALLVLGLLASAVGCAVTISAP